VTIICALCRCGFAVSLAIFALSAGAAEPVLSASSYGRITFGMSMASAERMLREKVGPPGEFEDESCRYIKFKAYPYADFMIENGIITRADVSAEARNALGIAVGDSLSSVMQRFPKVAIEPNHYDQNDHDLIFKRNDGKAAVIAGESQGKIIDIRAGLRPSVGYVEGCL
jgi:hypothetical protein